MTFAAGSPAHAQEALDALKQGKPVIFPTDTIYGLGISVRDAESPEILYQIKARPKRKPVAWLVSGVDALSTYGVNVPEFAQALARTFWPGPLTIIVEASDKVPEAFRSNEGTIGLRCPKGDFALSLIEELGCPIATTSANPSGLKAPRFAEGLDEDLCSKVAVVVTDDEEKSGIASTIVDCTSGCPVLTREGSISIEEIRARS